MNLSYSCFTVVPHYVLKGAATQWPKFSLTKLWQSLAHLDPVAPRCLFEICFGLKIKNNFKVTFFQGENEGGTWKRAETWQYIDTFREGE